MKYLLYSCLLISFPVYSQYKYRVEIKLLTNSSISSGTLELLDNNRIKGKVVSKKFVGGKVVFAGEMEQPCKFGRLSINKVNKVFNIDFVIDSMDMKIDLGIDDKALIIKSINGESNRIFNELNAISKKNHFAYALNRKKSEPYIVLPSSLANQNNIEMVKHLSSYQGNYFSVLALNWLSLLTSDVEYSKLILSTLENLNSEIRNSLLGTQIYQKETAYLKSKELTKVGSEVLVFEVKDINNAFFSNKELQGQCYVIVFSATWCIPCQYQLPKLKKIYDKYKANGLKLVYFNLDDDVNRWQKHVTENDLTWINVSERVKSKYSNISKMFGVSAVPTCFLVDRTGKIIYNSEDQDHELNDLEKVIEGAFNNQ